MARCVRPAAGASEAQADYFRMLAGDDGLSRLREPDDHTVARVIFRLMQNG
jgi:hypothetical protein